MHFYVPFEILFGRWLNLQTILHSLSPPVLKFLQAQFVIDDENEYAIQLMKKD